MDYWLRNHSPILSYCTRRGACELSFWMCQFFHHPAPQQLSSLFSTLTAVPAFFSNSLFPFSLPKPYFHCNPKKNRSERGQRRAAFPASLSWACLPAPPIALRHMKTGGKCVVYCTKECCYSSCLVQYSATISKVCCFCFLRFQFFGHFHSCVRVLYNIILYCTVQFLPLYISNTSTSFPLYKYCILDSCVQLYSRHAVWPYCTTVQYKVQYSTVGLCEMCLMDDILLVSYRLPVLSSMIRIFNYIIGYSVPISITRKHYL